MRKKMQFLQVVLCIACFVPLTKITAAPKFSDSVKIVHVLDGNLNEWQKDKFETDKETEVLFAVDHDDNNLHLALKIPNIRTQMKMMRMGMNLYIDKKGKHREGMGVQFPSKNDGVSGDGGGARNNGGTPPDPKAMRDQLATGMIFLRTFGFDDEDKTQLITAENGINIAFGWDEANVMYIEYQVPMSMIGKKQDLTGKPIGIGWKINGASNERTATSTQLVSVPASSRSIPGVNPRGGSGPGASGSMGSSSSNDPAFREQSFWTKYNLNF